jgi:hypothetical protein
MSNQTLEIYKQDIANWTAAIKAVNLPNLSQEAGDRQANHAKCREYVVSNFPSVPLPCPILHENFYKLSLLALSEKNELILEKPVEVGYRMGQLFQADDEDKHEIADLPPSPNDPWLQNDFKENLKKSAEESFLKYGRVLNQNELLQAQRLEAFQATAGKYDESETVHKIINGRSYIDRTATAKIRAAARAKNAALKGGK